MRVVRTCSFVLLLVSLHGVSAAQSEPPPAAEPKTVPASATTSKSWTPPPYYDLYPDNLPYEKGQPVPNGYVVEKTSGTWAIVIGSVAVGVFYTYGLLATKRSDGDAAWLFLPVLGPPALLVTHRGHCKPRCFGIEQGSLVVDAIGQAAGAALFVAGFALSGSRLVREDLARPRALVVAPMQVGSGYGVGAVGSF